MAQRERTQGRRASGRRSASAGSGNGRAAASASANGRDHDANGKRAGERPPLEAIVNDVVLGPGPRFLPGLPAVKFGAKLAGRPQVAARQGLGLATEVGKIALGRSKLEPDKGDRRFKDPAWKKNPAFRRLLQLYLATEQAVDGTVSGAELDWRSERRMRFLTMNVLDAIAPSNFPLTNPTVLKAAIDSGGLNFVQGARQLAGDMRRPPRIPSSVDETKFEVGRDVARTPGAVVFRTEVFELIQYDPQTEKVREVPMLVSPHMVNKYYALDLAPGRSMLEYHVRQGQQVFVISWRNPDERHSDWNFDTYAQAVLDALDVVERITGSDKTLLTGTCAGGNVAAMAMCHLAATGQQDRIAALSLPVTATDFTRAGMMGAFIDEGVGVTSMAEAARRGYVNGSTMAGAFAWMRPNDMIWGYVVNNYLLGKPPPPFDVLYWNSDQTNVPAGLHRDFIQLGLENSFTQPGAMTVLGTPVDLSTITVDSYLVAAIADHIVPWQSAYATTQLLGRRPRFVLSSSGHIVALVNPPGNPKSEYYTNEATPPDPEEWLAGATTHKGSWWPDWSEWLGERAGEEKDAPREPGSDEFPALGEAPGTYVRQRISS